MCLFAVVFQAFVFDFGGEMYVWTAKHVPLDVRRHVLKLATSQWQSGYDYSQFPVNPLCPLIRESHLLLVQGCASADIYYRPVTACVCVSVTYQYCIKTLHILRCFLQTCFP